MTKKTYKNKSKEAEKEKENVTLNPLENDIDPVIQSQPININSKIKSKKAQEERQKLIQISKLVDQLRIMTDQPTEEEMDKKGAKLFRRPEPPVEK